MQSVNLDNAAAALRSNPNVLAAWVFGSARDGVVGKESDVDIAALYDRIPSLDESCDLREALQKALEFEEVDFVDVSRASPVLQMEALAGRCLVNRDREKVAVFQSYAARLYEDERSQAMRNYLGR